MTDEFEKAKMDIARIDKERFISNQERDQSFRSLQARKQSLHEEIKVLIDLLPERHDLAITTIKDVAPDLLQKAASEILKTSGKLTPWSRKVDTHYDLYSVQTSVAGDVSSEYRSSVHKVDVFVTQLAIPKFGSVGVFISSSDVERVSFVNLWEDKLNKWDEGISKLETLERVDHILNFFPAPKPSINAYIVATEREDLTILCTDERNYYKYKNFYNIYGPPSDIKNGLAKEVSGALVSIY